MNQPNQARLTKDGFINVCFIGSCPEIKKEHDQIWIRNSKQPTVVIKFSEVAFNHLKEIITSDLF